MNSPAASSSSWSSVRVVVGRVDEHLVDAGALGGDVDRAVVVDGEALLAVERRVQVGHDPHPPLAALADRLERRGSGFLVAGAERARTTGFDIVESYPGCEIGRALGPLGNDRDPTAGELIQPHLTHDTSQDTSLRRKRVAFRGSASTPHSERR